MRPRARGVFRYGRDYPGPVGAVPPQRVAPRVTGGAYGNMSRVLLVEDHSCFRQALGWMLSLETDFETNTQAGSLAEARACLSGGKAEGIDAAIVDIGLPDGTELIREI